MWRNPMWKSGDVKSILGRRERGLCVIACLACLFAPSLSGAQTIGTALKTGVLTFGDGSVVRVTVSEIGARTAASSVEIVLHDAADQVVSSTKGVLRRGAPVRLELPLAKGVGFVQLRASIFIFGLTDQGSSPVAVLEDLDPNSLTVVPKVVCAAERPTGSGGAQTLCAGTGFVVTNPTSGG